VGPDYNLVCRQWAAIALIAVLCVTAAACGPKREPKPNVAEGGPPGRVLRVCADPNNLPFSNDRGEGFENHLASMLARGLHASVSYTWWAQRRGFIRNTLKAGACDVVMGLPVGFEMAATTRPYYRSTYVFVSRTGRARGIDSFDDRRLRRMRIGVQIIGDDYANAPPAHALASRQLVSNVVGYSVYGDYSQPDPPRRIVDAVATGQVDVAVVWGPLAGFFAARSPVPLELTPVVPPADLPYLPFAFDIGMGVRRKDTALRSELDTWIGAHGQDINRLLADFHIPRADQPATAGTVPESGTVPTSGTVPQTGTVPGGRP
jgi:mxaJ protein